MRLGYWLLFLILVLPTKPQADVWLQLAADESGNSCTIDVNELVTVHVLMSTFGEGATGVRFAAPIPSAPGLTHVGDVSSYYLLGNSQVDVTVPFGTCRSGTFVVMTMYFYPASEGESCTSYEIQPGAVYTDCSYGEYPLRSSLAATVNRNGNSRHATDPDPIDGAQNVPLTTMLQWSAPCRCNPLLHGDTVVYFGTSADPSLYAYGDSPVGVGPLSASTTYYWKVRHYDAVEDSPVWSFTTTSDVATKPSTWGAVKALYR